MKNIFISDHILAIALVLVSTLFSHVTAQDNQSDFQSGFEFRAFYAIDEKWTYDGSYSLRGFVPNKDRRRFNINPSFVYSATENVNYRGGLRFVYTLDKDVSNTLEVRPWQGLRVIWPRMNYIIFSHYIRLEERLSWGTEDGSFSFILRTRYQISVKTPNLRWETLNLTFYFLTSLELLAEIEDAIQETMIDHGRLSFGIGFFITQDWRLEVSYVLQGSILWDEKRLDVDDNILNLKLRYDINLMDQ